jgi:hypothetical protein
MKLFKQYTLFTLSLVLTAVCVKSQSITGDTIYVDAKAEIAVRFPSMPSSFYTIPADAPYNFKTLSTGFTIIAKSKNTGTVPLFVTEGKRTHHFLIVYKKDINYNNFIETEYDYSTIKKLKDHVRQLEERQKTYDTTIVSANQLFDAGDYANSKILYTKALGLLNRSWPKEQIKKINVILAKLRPGKKNKKKNQR